MILKYLCCFLAFIQFSFSAEIQRAKLVSYQSQRIVIQTKQLYKQQNIVPTELTKEIYFFSDPEFETNSQKKPNNVGWQQKYQTTRNTIHKPNNVHLKNNRDSSESQRIESLRVQKYGSGTTAGVQRRWLPSTQQYKTSSSNNNIKTRSILPENTPVDKNYAINFLPTGIDVVPGSSYIPLIKKL